MYYVSGVTHENFNGDTHASKITKLVAGLDKEHALGAPGCHMALYF